MKIKENSITLDSLDSEILRAIQADAKQTYAQIGRHLNVAHSTVYDRIKRLEEHGIIKKYTAIVDLQKVREKFVTAILTIFTHPKESENIAKKLSMFKEVLEVFTSLSEELLIIVKVVAEDQDTLHSFVARSIAPLSGVLRIKTSIITKKHKEEGFRLVQALFF